MDLNQIFARHLKAARKKRDITQEHLADLLGVSRQAVSKWENGDGYPEVEKLILLSRELRVSLDSLFALHVASGTDEAEANESTAEASVPTSPPYVRLIQPSERIAISSYDGEKLCLCYDVRATRSIGSGEIKYVLLAITEKGFWSRKEEIIGWYTDLDAVKKEIKAVHAAIAAGETRYQLQFFTPVEVKGMFGAPRVISESRES
ncbi:helix-turn-helix transcriptional regulator [Trueperella pyogenes]|uniref:helix-turn-helix transcriptional regulator n=1 Tax=Trueperella pyogenes TaxID=1661 RepID=UPI0021697C47|nr:helix-turn-helix domain-containing protein [Trueperella pyogenes]UVJ58127.1 helix-turn-helix domain-containing protein [Trueperella pyogenes]